MRFVREGEAPLEKLNDKVVDTGWYRISSTAVSQARDIVTKWNVCWTFRDEMKGHDWTYPANVSALHFIMDEGRIMPSCWLVVDPHSGFNWDFATFLQTQYSVIVSFSCCLHLTIYPAWHMTRFKKLCFFLHNLNYHTCICCFPIQALNLFITVRCYFMFSAMMSHAMPWHCDVVHPTWPNLLYEPTVMSYFTASEPLQTVGTKGASIVTNNTNSTYSFLT